MQRRGIILAGGNATRLWPLTQSLPKSLLPIYNTPIIYYPLYTLINLGIKEIAIVGKYNDIALYQKLLNTGKQLGISLNYYVQNQANGIAEVFLITEKFIKDHYTCLILGDNIFISDLLNDNLSVKRKGATIFGYKVKDPQRYGIVEFNNKNKVVSIEEKPKEPKSNYAVPGLYFYDKNVIKYVRELQPSPRGELEITDLHKIYLEEKKLHAKQFYTSDTWFDAGTFDSLLESSNFVQAFVNRKGIHPGCIEEIALKRNFIDKNQLQEQIEKMPDNFYTRYLSSLL